MCSGNYDSFFAGRGTGARVCWQWHFSLAFYTTWPRRLLGPPCQSRLRGVFLTVGTPFLASCLLERNRWFWDSAGDFCRVKMKLRVARKKGAAWHLLYLLEFPLQIFLKYKGGLGETHHDPILPSGHWPLFTSLWNHGRWVIGYPRWEKMADGTDARCLDPFWVLGMVVWCFFWSIKKFWSNFEKTYGTSKFEPWLHMVTMVIGLPGVSSGHIAGTLFLFGGNCHGIPVKKWHQLNWSQLPFGFDWK